FAAGEPTQTDLAHKINLEKLGPQLLAEADEIRNSKEFKEARDKMADAEEEFQHTRPFTRHVDVFDPHPAPVCRRNPPALLPKSFLEFQESQSPMDNFQNRITSPERGAARVQQDLNRIADQEAAQDRLKRSITELSSTVASLKNSLAELTTKT